mmetsp:Transcript_12368/g.43053  ORF Transcript_12368/g.43053 Transcript_12368/m.43053 type:complete len:231 (+) Transcript_12368:4575-5267(+)
MKVWLQCQLSTVPPAPTTTAVPTLSPSTANKSSLVGTSSLSQSLPFHRSTVPFPPTANACSGPLTHTPKRVWETEGRSSNHEPLVSLRRRVPCTPTANTISSMPRKSSGTELATERRREETGDVSCIHFDPSNIKIVPSAPTTHARLSAVAVTPCKSGCEDEEEEEEESQPVPGEYLRMTPLAPTAHMVLAVMAKMELRVALVSPCCSTLHCKVWGSSLAISPRSPHPHS